MLTIRVTSGRGGARAPSPILLNSWRKRVTKFGTYKENISCAHPKPLHTLNSRHAYKLVRYSYSTRPELETTDTCTVSKNILCKFSTLIITIQVNKKIKIYVE